MKVDKTKVIAIIAMFTTIILLGALTYAFFSYEGINENQNFSAGTGTIQLTFADNDNGINANLKLGESATKRFTVENTGTLDAVIFIYFEDFYNSYTKGSLTYTLTYSTSENGEYKTLVLNQAMPVIPVMPLNVQSNSLNIIADNLSIHVGQKYYYEFTVTYNHLDDVDQTDDLNAIFNTKFMIKDVKDKPLNPDFSKPATTDEGVYALEDDYGTSYYYRGASEYNYIKYGKDKNGNDMYWRIIRINGDESLRIIYDGTQAYENGSDNSARYAIRAMGFNSIYTDAKYVGWMFGGAKGVASTSKEQAQMNETDSQAKSLVDSWYKENIVDTGYANDVVDAIFCNDRSIPGKEETEWADDTGLGYAKNATAYGIYTRIGVSGDSNDIVQPKFTCEVQNDAFTVEKSDIGNGALTYPVGLITADEMLAAGSGKWHTPNTSYYLFKTSSYYGYTMTPFHMNPNGYSYTCVVSLNGQLDNYAGVSHVYNAFAPVINLSAEYARKLIGDGSMSNPYRAEGVAP